MKDVYCKDDNIAGITSYSSNTDNHEWILIRIKYDTFAKDVTNIKEKYSGNIIVVDCENKNSVALFKTMEKEL